MSGERIELASARGDQTIGKVRFVAHGSSLRSGRTILENGVSFIEGRATLTTNLIQALGYATDPVKRGYSLNNDSVSDDPGMMTVLAVPTDFYLGYAVFTTAYIIRSSKLVMGAPLRYAGGRKQLALYLSSETEVARRRVESEIMAGRALTEQPSFMIDPQYVLGSLEPTAALHDVLSWVEVSAKAFEPIDFNRVENALSQLFVCREPAQQVLVPTMVRDLVVGTVESVIISRLRMMRWQGLALLGYRFSEGHEDVVVTRVADIAEQRRRMDECGRLLASSNIFSGELAWLKPYAAHQLDLMRVELDGAELEGL